MHPFIYVAPSTLDEAVAVLEQHGERARPFAGGTDVLVQLRGGRFELDAIVDLKGVPEATELSLNGILRIGAAVPCYRIYEDSAVAAAFPGLIDAASLIGGIQIQSRASLGGNLCNASPSADGICPLIVHSTVGVVRGPQGERRVPVEEFCTGPGANVLGRGELLVALEAPAPPKGFGAAYQRFIPRNEMDIAVAGV
ncbi:MAG: FAD binding domain-containing protein, partial [Chloroflexi bacterium]|nr:FAD binding domain-containing protein [Chloroflexota bacterium]